MFHTGPPGSSAITEEPGELRGRNGRAGHGWEFLGSTPKSPGSCTAETAVQAEGDSVLRSPWWRAAEFVLRQRRPNRGRDGNGCPGVGIWCHPPGGSFPEPGSSSSIGEELCVPGGILVVQPHGCSGRGVPTLFPWPSSLGNRRGPHLRSVQLSCNSRPRKPGCMDDTDNATNPPIEPFGPLASGVPSPFQGGNAGSNPVRDTNDQPRRTSSGGADGHHPSSAPRPSHGPSTARRHRRFHITGDPCYISRAA